MTVPHMNTRLTLSQKIGGHIADWLSEHIPQLETSIKEALSEKVITDAKTLHWEGENTPDYDLALVDLSMKILNLDESYRDYMTFLICKDQT